MSNLASNARADLGNAFDEIREKAHQMFDALHERNRQAIDDQHRLVDEALDSQQKAIQGTVDTYKAQIEAQRSLRRETELRQAVSEAKGPEDQIRAQQALADFLADQQAQLMQESATAEIAKLQLQRDANDKIAAEQQTAEDKRFQDQVAHFDKELSALQEHLDRHPGAWRKIQGDILDLLDKYGTDYETAGATLGEKFVAGLNSQVEAAEAAASALRSAGSGTPTANSFIPWTPPAGTPPGLTVPNAPKVIPKSSAPVSLPGVSGYAVGAWKLMKDQLAFLHSGEMVVPADLAGSLRSTLGEDMFGGQQGRDSWSNLGSAGSPLSGALGAPSETGGGTLILQVDGNEMYRVTDERLAVRESLVTVRPPGRF